MQAPETLAYFCFPSIGRIRPDSRYRRRYNATFREELADRYDVNIAKACDEFEMWWEKFSALSPNQLDKAKKIIAENKFSDRNIQSDDAQIVDVLKYYQISREDK